MSDFPQRMPFSTAPFDEPWGERYFPEGLTEQPLEDLSGTIERVKGHIKDHPWQAIGLAVALGLLIGVAGTPKPSPAVCVDEVG